MRFDDRVCYDGPYFYVLSFWVGSGKGGKIRMQCSGSGRGGSVGGGEMEVWVWTTGTMHNSVSFNRGRIRTMITLRATKPTRGLINFRIAIL